MNKWQLAVLFSAMSLLFSICGVLCGASLGNCLIFALYQIFCIFLPGMGISSLFSGNDRKTGLQILCISYAFGYALNVLAYFITAAAGLSMLAARLVASVLLISGLWLSLKRRKRLFQLIYSRNPVFLLLFAAFCFVVFFAYSAVYSLPVRHSGVIAYHADALYWIENASALTKSFPPAELRLSGSTLYYHYFASAYIAFAEMVTGIDAFSLGYVFYAFGKCLIVFGGIYELADVITDSSVKKIFILLALLFSTGLEKYTIANYVAHILTLPFGFDIAYGFGAYFLAFLLKQSENEEFSFYYFFTASVAFLMCAGHKAPIAMIYLLIAGVICLGWLLRKNMKKAFSYGSSFLLCFLAVMVICIGFGVSGESRVNGGTFSHVATLRATPFFPKYEEIALSRVPGIKGYFSLARIYFISMLKFCLCIHPLILLLELNGIADIICRKKITNTDAALLSGIIFGLFMGFFNAQEGVSQLYYTLATYLPGMVFGMLHFPKRKGGYKLIFSALCAVVLVFQCYCFFISRDVCQIMKAGFENAFYPDSAVTESDELKFPAYSLQKSDYDALVWIRNHIPEDAVVVSDRSVLTDTDNYMFYGTFCERQMYLEGDRYFYNTYLDVRSQRRETIKSLYNGSPDALDTVYNDGAGYVIQTKWLSPEFSGVGCTLLYETDTLAVWQINSRELI